MGNESDLTRDELLADVLRKICESGEEASSADLETELEGLSDLELADLVNAGHCLNLLQHLDDLPNQTSPGLEGASRETTRLDSDKTTTTNRTTKSTAMSKSVGRFEIKRLAAKGGFAEIYHAYDPNLEREVALKIPMQNLFEDSSARQRFEREARAVAALTHPTIVPVYESGAVDGKLYIALEWVPGQNLRTYLKESDSPVEARHAAIAICRIAEAVGHAHQRGVLHRDLKPANVLLDDKVSELPWYESLRVTDFGLAKHFDQQAIDNHLTNEGAMLGTPAYMSPEQVRAGDIGPASDVYALGVMLFEILTGSPPHKRDSYVATIRAIEQDPVPELHKARKNVPHDLAVICEKCLQKNASRRYANGLELMDDLQRFLDGMPIRARKVSPVEQLQKWVVRNPFVATCLAVTIATLIFATVATSQALQRSQQTAGDLKNQLTIMQSIFQDLDSLSGVVLEEFELRDRLGERLIESADQIVQLPSDSATQSELISTFGKALVAIGNPAEAERVVNLAMESAQDSRAKRSDILKLEIQRAYAISRQWRYSKAQEILNEIMDEVLASGELDNTLKAQTIILQAVCAQQGEQPKLAETLLEKALIEIPRFDLGEEAEPRLLAMIRQRLANIRFWRSPSDQGLTQLRRELDAVKKVYVAGHPHTTVAACDLGSALIHQKRFDRAIEVSERAFRDSQHRYGVANVHSLLAINVGMRAMIRNIRKQSSKIRLRQILPLIESNWESVADRLGRTHPALVLFRKNVATAHGALGFNAKQIEILDELVDELESGLGRQSEETQVMVLNLAMVLHQNGNVDRSIELLNEVIETRSVPPGQYRVAKQQLVLARLKNVVSPK